MSVTMPYPIATSNTDNTVDALLDDRRCAPRMQRPLAAEVRPVGLSESHRCDVEDISEGGLFVSVPFSYGLNVGQRCEIQFAPVQSPAQCPTSETCYATVVRTEVIATETGKRLGAGLRFDQPLFL